MSAPDPRMRWWGWGVDHDAPPLPGGTEALLREVIGWNDRSTPPVGLDAVELAPPVLEAGARAALAEIVGKDNVRDDRLARVAHAVGKSYPDLVRIRAGDGSTAPDAVVYPGTDAEVGALLSLCGERRIAVVPFGGGTSVVGGVETVRDGFSGAVTLDLARMDGLLDVDRRSLLATFAAGMTGPQAEAALAQHGLTLGHFPQSYEYATIGGFVATRSAGQNSTGYGRIDELVHGLKMVGPAGELTVPPFPASAAGPALRELVVGSEGTLGVITQASLRVRPRPAAQRFEAWSFRSFDAGAEAYRALEQAGIAPTVARLSDEHETRFALAVSASGGLSDRVGRAYLNARGHRAPCLGIVGFEGGAREVRRRRRRTASSLRSNGGVFLGVRPGERWLRTRFLGPYLRDPLLDRGVLVETLETAATWSALAGLYAAVADALREALGRPGRGAFVMCHISHLYATGASLYFTFAACQEEGRELEQWHRAKSAACDAIVAHGGTITHHHAIGRDHSPWLAKEIGPLGVEALRALKGRLDPAGVMNPGKLIDGARLPGAPA